MSNELIVWEANRPEGWIRGTNIEKSAKVVDHIEVYVYIIYNFFNELILKNSVKVDEFRVK